MMKRNKRSLSMEEEERLMKAIVIGGGIGGMAAALSLRNEGIEVEVYEQARALTEIGAGLQIAPSAGRVLERLGLGAELERLAITMRRLEMHDLRSDRLIHSVSPDWGGPFYQVHRPDLLGMLGDALPRGVVRLGQRADGFAEEAGGVTVEFESGHRARGDVLIGADGIHSLVRRHLFGEQELDFSHIVAWRALIPCDRLAHLDLPFNCEVWLGPDRSAVTYWVHAGELLNFVGMVPAREAAEESWTATGELTALRRSYAGSCPRLAAIIDEIETPFITGYYFRYPLERWSRGRITLLGDAAHPMHPFLAQGACQAIEDGAVLGRVLGDCGGSAVQRALAEYQARRPSTAGCTATTSTPKPAGRPEPPRDPSSAPRRSAPGRCGRRCSDRAIWTVSTTGSARRTTAFSWRTFLPTRRWTSRRRRATASAACAPPRAAARTARSCCTFTAGATSSDRPKRRPASRAGWRARSAAPASSPVTAGRLSIHSRLRSRTLSQRTSVSSPVVSMPHGS